MRTRNWSIRSKIVAMITAPMVAFLALWIFATVLTAGPAFNLLHARTFVNEVANPGIDLVTQLQRERLFSVQYLAGSGPVPKTLGDQWAATDRAVAEFRRSAGGKAVRDAATDALRNRITQVFTELDSLGGNRGHINRREIDAIGAQGFYNRVIDAAFQMFAACATFDDESINRELRALTTVGNGEEYLGRVDSLVAGATAAGSLNPDMRNELLQDVGTGRFLLAQGIDDMTVTERSEWVQLSASDGYVRLDKMLDELVQDSRENAAPPVPSTTFRPLYVSVGQQVREFENRATDALAKRATPMAIEVLMRLALAAVLGLLALVLSIIVSVKIGRSIIGRLRRLRAEAQEMADERLPTVVRRLQRGEPVDVDVETPPLEYGADEIGQLGTAFNNVQRTAVQSAVDEAAVRRGINEVFLNIARRSQTLLHRQLALLDKMERREAEPRELEDLYRVDHLATRMRRHAEDLVILAGAAPGRGWRNPVPVIDVVRGAISEVEDYKRIDIRSIEQSAVLGRAVGDVIHLLAELLENAASFSPPHTRVQVSGQVLPNGYAVEIEDRGLGMPADAIEEANRRLFEPPDFDPSDSARLGLFVVAQLAGRHGIRVSLRPSVYGGVTAIVLLPADLVVAGSGPPALPAGRSWERPLVGSGTDDPARHSLAALQWQGAEEVREITATGQPVTINGTVLALPGETGWEPVEPRLTGHRGGPSPSTVADELSEDGLVQRRRARRPSGTGSPDEEIEPGHDPEPAIGLPSPVGWPAPTGSPAGLDRLGRLGSLADLEHDLGIGPSSGAGPAMFNGHTPVLPDPAVLDAPTISLPVVDKPGAGTPSPAPGPDAAPGPEPATEDGLPRRIRQANLAPQLRRRPASSRSDEDTVPFRSPEQIRSIMTALQQGTTRGRIDAARIDASPTSREGDPTAERPESDETGKVVPLEGPSFADAATVSFPALVNLAFARDETPETGGDEAVDDPSAGPGRNDVTRPEKDAE